MNMTAYHVTESEALPIVPTVRKKRWQGLRQNTTVLFLSLAAVHVLFGIGCANLPILSLLHAASVLLVGLWFALFDRRLERLAYACAYLVGSEVIWRMTQAGVFYEYGKYGLATILLVATVRNELFRGTPMAWLYFLLLLPSAVLPSIYASDAQLRDMVSFNLSGPFALATSIWCFSQITLKKEHLPRISLSLLLPTISVAGIAAYRLLTTENVMFGRSSSKLGSGGFGPNQVSSTLGLGILAAVFFVILEKRELMLKLLIFALFLGLGAQAALTFSRTGLYLAVGSVVVAFFCIYNSRKMLRQLSVAALALFLVVNYFLLPKLNQFTNGALLERFQNTNTTGRGDLFLADLHIWFENPVFGIGPGLGGNKRLTLNGDEVSSHTEYSRLLAEHGIFGLFALFALLGICALNFRRARTPYQRAFVWSLLFWSLMYMLGAAMRTVAPAYLIGLTSITFARSLPENTSHSDLTQVPATQ